MARATDAVTIVKRMTYRGVGEEWSNTYHLSGTTPTTPAAWKTLIDAMVAVEKNCYESGSKVVRGYGYKSGQDAAEYTVDYTALGAETLGVAVRVTGQTGWAGDQAGMLRATRVTRTAAGKPVYLRKYYHSGISESSNGDSVQYALRQGYLAMGAKLLDGTLPGSMKWCAPNGELASLPIANAWVTTRTLKRRGKRPTVPAGQ